MANLIMNSPVRVQPELCYITMRISNGTTSVVVFYEVKYIHTSWPRDSIWSIYPTGMKNCVYIKTYIWILIATLVTITQN